MSLTEVIQDRINTKRLSASDPQAAPAPNRWWRLGQIESTIKDVAEEIPTMTSPPAVRLLIASQAVGREISSYKDLKEHEVAAIYEVIATRRELLKQWVREQCGEQLLLFDQP